MPMDARSNVNDMSTSSEERRRTEAELVRAIDMDPRVGAPATYDAVCRFVDLLADDGQLPETVVIAFKAALAESEALQRFAPDVRDAIRSALVSTCIHRYFTRRVADDVRIPKGRTLRLVRDEAEPPARTAAPDASA